MERLIFKNERGASIELGNAYPFILTKIENTGAPEVNITSTKAPRQDGTSYHGTTLEPRTLPIYGTIVANDENDVYVKRRKLASVFSPKLEGELIYENAVGEYKIGCVVEELVWGEQLGEMQDFLIQLYCPNPYWSNVYESKTEVAIWRPLFEFPLEIDIDEGIEFGYREPSLIAHIYNDGDMETGMRIVFKALGTVVNPSLFDINTRKYIKINQTLKAGDRLVVNTAFGNKRVDLIKSDNRKYNVLHWIDVRSEFIQLEVGENLFRYDAEEGLDNLEVDIYYNKLYVGV